MLQLIFKNIFHPVNGSVIVIAGILTAWVFKTRMEIFDAVASTAIIGLLTFIGCSMMNIIRGNRMTSTWILIENRTQETVYLQWGVMLEGSTGLSETLQLEPSHVTSRKVKHDNEHYFSGKYPCIRVSRIKNSTAKNVTIILLEPSEQFHTKLYEITEDGINEFRNPEHRNWHTGDMDCYDLS